MTLVDFDMLFSALGRGHLEFFDYFFILLLFFHYSETTWTQ